jgi:hypothetical protein
VCDSRRTRNQNAIRAHLGRISHTLCNTVCVHAK